MAKAATFVARTKKMRTFGRHIEQTIHIIYRLNDDVRLYCNYSDIQ